MSNAPILIRSFYMTLKFGLSFYQYLISLLNSFVHFVPFVVIFLHRIDSGVIAIACVRMFVSDMQPRMLVARECRNRRPIKKVWFTDRRTSSF
jgi:hypothetical protein